MARKKSAAKKAKEAELKLQQETEAKPQAEQPKKKVQKVESESESEESEESEDEDEYGDLVTENIDKGISKVLEAIKTDPSKLLDKDTKFYDEDEEVVTDKKEKPMYLKDYHRMNLLSGGYKEDEYDNEYGTVDGEKPFVVTEREERNQLLSDIKSAFNDDDSDEDDDFLKKKETDDKPDDEPTTLPDPEVNENDFLQSFLDKKAWIPTKKDKVINLDRKGEDDDEFDEAAEKFENAYNFRYEEENAAEIISYARNQATLRRDKTNSRKRQRERQHEEKLNELKAKEEKLRKKEVAKVNKVTDRLNKIKNEIGGDIKEEVLEKVFGDSLLNDDFDDADWDNKMAEIFNEQYYGEEISKPEFSDMDLSDIEDEEKPKKSKKDKLKEKKEAKKSKKSVKEKAQAIVEANKTKIIEEIEEEDERGRSKDDDIKFKYREVSPESYGLTTRDIFMADDKQLNSYIGIKKFAPYRPQELRVKDRRKYKKKRLVTEWRKEVFKDQKIKDDDGESIWIPVEEKKEKKDKKHKKDKKDKKEKHKHD